MDAASGMPMILLSGMAADERLFARQFSAFPNLTVPRWIDPLPDESLAKYATRFAHLIDPKQPCIVGGASFGGIVALEMCAEIRPSACVLIASVRSPGEMPWWHRAIRPAANFGPARLAQLAGLVASVSAPSLPATDVRSLRRMSQPQSAFIRWATWAVLNWRPSPSIEKLRILQIHGALDRTFPVQRSRANEIVANAGHALPLTHPAAVNEFLHRALASVSSLQ